MKYLLLFVLFVPQVEACDLEPHGFLRVGAGWTGKVGEDSVTGDLAADLSIGYRWPLSREHSIDITLSDNSYWFVGPPFNDDPEETQHHLNIGYEFRF